jgi:hypothetical protein
MAHRCGLIIGLCFCVGLATGVQAAEDPPASDPTLAADQAKAVSKAVKRDVKVVVDATKEGAQQVATVAKDVAQEVATATKEGAEEVAATAKRGTARAKAAVNGEKPVKPAPKPADKAADPPAQ